jgi:hypothetical protein
MLLHGKANTRFSLFLAPWHTCLWCACQLEKHSLFFCTLAHVLAWSACQLEKQSLFFCTLSHVLVVCKPARKTFTFFLHLGTRACGWCACQLEKHSLFFCTLAHVLVVCMPSIREADVAAGEHTLALGALEHLWFAFAATNARLQRLAQAPQRTSSSHSSFLLHLLGNFLWPVESKHCAVCFLSVCVWVCVGRLI